MIVIVWYSPEQAGKFLLLCFLIIPVKTWKVNDREIHNRKHVRFLRRFHLHLNGGYGMITTCTEHVKKKREVYPVISYIRGPLEEKREDSVVIEAGNIGYRIFIPPSLLGELPGLGEEVKIYTYFSVREDGMSLFGFLSKQDLEMFRQLIGVNGVGPKSALGILSALKPDVLRMAVLSGDAKAISKAPGVGAKTAQRIILDLKDKVKAEDVLFAGADLAENRNTDLSGMEEAGKEAVEALTALGYSSSEAQTAVKKVTITENMTSEDVLKGALKYLAFL